MKLLNTLYNHTTNVKYFDIETQHNFVNLSI